MQCNRVSSVLNPVATLTACEISCQLDMPVEITIGKSSDALFTRSRSVILADGIFIYGRSYLLARCKEGTSQTDGNHSPLNILSNSSYSSSENSISSLYSMYVIS